MGWIETLGSYLEDDAVLVGVRVVGLLVFGALLARVLSGLVGRVVSGRGTPQHVLIARRATLYLVVVLVLLSVLRQLGLDLGVLLGAAGILTVAVGFASQTSASNVISGLFLLGEQPFVVGDVIKVGNTTGEVVSVDLLSVKLRTFDNLFVRVPNESLIKSEITNLTRFEIRRVELLVSVAYKEDLARVSELMLALADRTPEVLDDPRPEVHVQEFGDSGVILRYLLWTTREGWYALRTRMMQALKSELDAAGIEIPFPHVSIYAGSATEPIPVRQSP